MMHLADWVWGQGRDHILHITHSSWSAAPWMLVNWTSVYKFLAAAEVFVHYNSYLEILVSTSTGDWVERLISEMTYNMLIGTLNPTHSLTHFQQLYVV